MATTSTQGTSSESINEVEVLSWEASVVFLEYIGYYEEMETATPLDDDDYEEQEDYTRKERKRLQGLKNKKAVKAVESILKASPAARKYFARDEKRRKKYE